MDKIELKVTMEPERLDALRYFLSRKGKANARERTAAVAGRAL